MFPTESGIATSFDLVMFVQNEVHDERKAEYLLNNHIGLMLLYRQHNGYFVFKHT